MKALEMMRRRGATLAVCSLFVFTMGCNKMLSNFSLSQAEKKRAEAMEYKADTHAPEDLLMVDDLITQAKGQATSEDFKTARLTAKDAATQAKVLLETTKQRRADFLRSEATDWINRAKLNEAQQANQQQFQTIIDTNDAGVASFDKQNYADAVSSFGKVVEDVKYLLQELKTRAENGLADVKKRKDQLIEVQAPDHYPEGLTKVDDDIEHVRSLIEEKYDYKTAIDAADYAIQAAEENKTKTKQIRSEKIVREVESALSQGTKLGAEIYATDNFNRVSRDFEELLSKHYEKQYDTVLHPNQGDAILVAAQDLILETRRESARARLENVEQAIQRLEADKVRVYLPGNVEQMQEKYDLAKADFDQNNFEKTEEIAREALEMEKRVIQEFDQLVDRHKTGAAGELAVAKEVMGRAREIFDMAVPVAPGSPEEIFEKQKQAMYQELVGYLANAEVDMGIVQIQREKQEFANAIETSQRIVEEAKRLMNETYKVVAFNALQNLANQVTQLETQGGREYAAEELDVARETLEKVRTLYHDEQNYRQALEVAGATQGRLEDTTQELERVALRTMASARQSLVEAGEARAEVFQPDSLEQSKNLLVEADAQLKGQSLQTAIKLAEEATVLADDAKSGSMRDWANEEIRRTKMLMARADEAGAEAFAPEEYTDAANMLRTAEALLGEGDFEQARLSGSRAVNHAERALYKLVLDAEDKVAEARRFGGWKWESDRLTEALVLADAARDYYEAGDFNLGRRAAVQSFTLADTVAVDAKRASFNSQLQSIDGKIMLAAQNGVAYYQSEDLAELLGELNRLATEFTPEGYEQAAEKIELLEAQLAGLVEMTPSVLEDLSEQLNEMLAAAEDRGGQTMFADLTAETAAKIKYMQLDFGNERYRPSFQNAQDAIRLLNKLDLMLDTRDYDLALSAYFNEYSKVLEDFGPVLNMGTPVMLEMIQGANGTAQAISILSASDPTEFRQSINDMVAQVRMLQPPGTRTNVHEAALEMLSMARDGATAFEKMLILDQYDLKAAREIVTQAYLQTSSARAKQQNIQASLEYPQTQTQLGGIRPLRTIETRGE